MISRALFFLLHALAGAALLSLLSTLQRWRFGFPIEARGFLVPVVVGAAIGLLVGSWRQRLQRQNRQLAHREERFRLLYQHTPVMLHSIDADDRLLAVSDCWLEEMGYQADEVIGVPLDQFLSEDSRRQLAAAGNLAQRLETGNLKEVPLQLVRRDGSLIDGLLSAVPERNEDGTLARGLGVVIDVTERKRAEQEVEKLAYYDALTGLPNRLLLQDRLHQAVAQARRHQTRGALLFLDLDRFKNINDTLGHPVGDALLQEVASRLRTAVREGDTVARLGGDEFIILLAEFRDDPDLAAIARKILKVVAAPVHLEGREIVISTSIGISVFPTEAGGGETLLRHADIAMYAAKEQGRNTFCFFSREMNERVATRLQMETDLRRALEREEFRLCYQPQLDLEAGRIIGAEVLLRWFPPGREPVPPDHFIPVAEETGLILPLGDWVLQEACRQAREWQEAGLGNLRVAVNISGRQFNQPGFIDHLDAVLAETGLPPGQLELEITEGTVMANTETAVMVMTDLRVRGIGLAIDDFGTGYSSLLYLKHFPINRIKIAQEFVRDIPGDRDDAAIVEAILAMANSLGIEVIAEGVELAAQVDFLHRRHCSVMQGFYFGWPLPAADFTALLRDGLGNQGLCLLGGEAPPADSRGR